LLFVKLVRSCRAVAIDTLWKLHEW
jgi:hypothetical protein